MTAALDPALPLLRCPVCGSGLRREDRTLRCGSGHGFDVARQGFVTLLAGNRPHHGDTTAMVAARDRFLGSGHYATIAAAVARAVRDAAPAGPVLDLAAGTGWYAAHVLDDGDRSGVAVDVSVPALKRAARAHPRLAAVGADAWAPLPAHDGSFAAVLSVFGPRTAPEAQRVLAAGGVVVTVTPTPDHLAELREPLSTLDVADDKVGRLREAFTGFDVVDGQRVRYPLTLGHPALADLVTMGPTGHHLDAGAVADRVASLPPTVVVTVAVDVTTFRRPS